MIDEAVLGEAEKSIEGRPVGLAKRHRSHDGEEGSYRYM